MSKGEQTKQRIIDAGIILFGRSGYSATGLNDILQEAQAPKGSFYFHFKGGKEELAQAVVEQHAQRFVDMMSEVFAQHDTAQNAAGHLVELLAEQFEASQCLLGCPVSNIAYEMAHHSEILRQTTELAYERWVHATAHALYGPNATPAQHAKARCFVAGIKGALIMSRAYGNAQPLRDFLPMIPRMLN